MGLGGGSKGRASFVVKRAVWRMVVVLVWRRFNSIRGMVDLFRPEVCLWGISLMVPVL